MNSLAMSRWTSDSKMAVRANQSSNSNSITSNKYRKSNQCPTSKYNTNSKCSNISNSLLKLCPMTRSYAQI